MINAKEELIEHVKDRVVKFIYIKYGDRYEDDGLNTIKGTIEDCLPLLDFNYDDGYGGQELFGHIWYEDGTWSERGEYDGSEWWDHKAVPSMDEYI